MRYPKWMWAATAAATVTVTGLMVVSVQEHHGPGPAAVTSSRSAPAQGSGGDQPGMACGRVYVIDGDTISCTINGQPRVRVRLVGINAPEVARDKKPGECHGAEATKELKRLLEGQHVTLKPDQRSEDRDRYGRLLRIASTPTLTNVGLQLVRDGHARAYDNNDPVYAPAQAAATREKTGMWAACDTVKPS